MSKEREVVNVTPGTRIKSEAERLAEAVQLNQGDGKSEDVQVPNGLLEITDDMSEEEKEGRRKINEFRSLPIEEQVARRATTLDRGILHDRLKVELPEELHGEWCRNDPLEINRMRSLGFWVDDRYATKRSIHSDGSSANVVGDAIHMCTTKDNKKLIDAVQMEQSRRAQGLSKVEREEEEFAHNTARDTGEIIPTFSDSRARTVTAADVRKAVATAEAQTRRQR